MLTPLKPELQSYGLPGEYRDSTPGPMEKQEMPLIAEPSVWSQLQTLMVYSADLCLLSCFL